MLLRFNKDFKYIVFDTETEHLNLHFSRPWQCSWLDCKGDKVVGVYDRMITVPNFKISKSAARVTNFDRSRYDREKRPSKEVLEEFTSFLNDKDYYYIGHNILNFDIYQVANWAREAGMDVGWGYLDRCIDTLCLAKAIHLGEKPPKSKHEMISWQYKFTNLMIKGTALGTLGKGYGIDAPYDNLHDALNDIELNHKVFLKQIQEIEI